MPPNKAERIPTSSGFSALSRKTKIVCTLGPATESEATLRDLLQAGMNVARLNCSHGTHAEHGERISRIRELADEAQTPVAILLDLAGPKVRVGSFQAGSVELRAGDRFTLTTRSVEGTSHKVSVSYLDLPREVKVGDVLLLSDGALELAVQQVTEEEIHCQVVVGETLSSHKGVNCPSGLLGLPILGEKDVRDLQFGLDQGVDYIGLSFVRTAEDVRAAKQEIAQRGGFTPIIAKIETHAALAAFDDILTEADGIMVARGDLAIETPFSHVPMIQKQLIHRANQQAKPVITATQMLWSMVHTPRPTRAEVADVANAIIDGSDAVMLSEETAIGQHPIRAVQTMEAIATDTERAWLRLFSPDTQEQDDSTDSTGIEAIAQAACHMATHLGIDALVTVTLSGLTARFVAKFRPLQPIIAATPKLETYRQLALVRGVSPLLLPDIATNRGEMIELTRHFLRQHGWQGKRVIIASSISADRNVLTTDIL